MRWREMCLTFEFESVIDAVCLGRLGKQNEEMYYILGLTNCLRTAYVKIIKEES